jgi:predicted DNA-binding transcriptional regulator AlpA
MQDERPASPFMRTNDAKEFLSLSNSTFWKLMKSDPDAPRPRRLGGVLLWDRSELQAWVERKPQFVNSYTDEQGG